MTFTITLAHLAILLSAAGALGTAVWWATRRVWSAGGTFATVKRWAKWVPRLVRAVFGTPETLGLLRRVKRLEDVLFDEGDLKAADLAAARKRLSPPSAAPVEPEDAGTFDALRRELKARRDGDDGEEEED